MKNIERAGAIIAKKLHEDGRNNFFVWHNNGQISVDNTSEAMKASRTAFKKLRSFAEKLNTFEKINPFAKVKTKKSK